MRTEWMDILLKISKSPDCSCPDCGTKKVRIAFKAISDDFGYTVIWCENCKHAAIVSRSKDENYFNRCETIPDNLIF